MHILNWYLLFLDLLLAAYIIVMGRHAFLRGRFFLHIFQQKGYKSSEFWHWMVDYWNRRIITGKHILYMIVIVVMLWLMSGTITGSAAIIILTFFGMFWFISVDFYRSSRQKKPLVYTARMRRLCIPFVLCCLILPLATLSLAYNRSAPHLPGFFSLLQVDVYILAFGWVLADALIPFFIFIAAAITAPIERRVHRHFIDEAKAKLARMPELTVIAITGSYGKTSTKFMIRDLLKERTSVCSTPGSYNTPMGICKVINNDLEAHHQVLILEMGARYEGNIDELCDIAEPDIAVVTNVGLAHLETFGSQDAIARTKSTLVRRLAKNGTAILNADDERVAAMATLREDIKVVDVGLERGSITASELYYDHQGTQFQVVMGNETEVFSTKLLGAHNVQNMLLAIGVASCFDIRLKTMAIAARTIEPIEHRLELKRQGDLYIIDDAFNSNPTGAGNAVEILAQFKTGRRIIITPGMIELGEREDEKNEIFGRQIGEAELDLVILVGEEKTEAIRRGIHQTDLPEDHIKVVGSLFKANEIVQGYAQPGDVILYENDLPDSFDE